MNACFSPGQFVQCTIGESCTGYGIECIAGMASNIISFAAQSSGTIVRATCVEEIQDWCDVSTATQESTTASSWVTYAGEFTAIVFHPRNILKPWGFLYPFSWQLWIALAVLFAIVTPVVSAVVHYDTGKTLVGNFGTFFPDVFHAHTDVDTFDRNNEPFSLDTSALSVAISIISKIVIALYACNLAAYVIFSDFGDSTSPTVPKVSSIATTPRYARYFPSSTVFDTLTAAFESYKAGKSDVVIESHVALRSIKTCQDKLQIIDGPKSFDVFAFSSPSTAFERAVRNMTIAYDAMSRTKTVTCFPRAQSITLQETLGMFVTFGACMVCIGVISVLIHATRHEDCSKTRRPESPESLPESIQV